MKKTIPLIVTTENKGVFFGYGEQTDGTIMKIHYKLKNGEAAELECEIRDLTISNGVMLVQKYHEVVMLQDAEQVTIKPMKEQ